MVSFDSGDSDSQPPLSAQEQTALSEASTFAELLEAARKVSGELQRRDVGGHRRCYEFLWELLLFVIVIW